MTTVSSVPRPIPGPMGTGPGGARKPSSFTIESLVGRRSPSPRPGSVSVDSEGSTGSRSPDLDPTGDYSSSPEDMGALSPPLHRPSTAHSPEEGEIIYRGRKIGGGAGSSFHPVIPGSSAALLNSLRLSAAAASVAGLPHLHVPGGLPHGPGVGEHHPHPHTEGLGCPLPGLPHLGGGHPGLPMGFHGPQHLGAGLPPPMLLGPHRESLYPWLMSRHGGLIQHRFGGKCIQLTK